MPTPTVNFVFLLSYSPQNCHKQSPSLWSLQRIELEISIQYSCTLSHLLHHSSTNDYIQVGYELQALGCWAVAALMYPLSTQKVRRQLSGTQLSTVKSNTSLITHSGFRGVVPFILLNAGLGYCLRPLFSQEKLESIQSSVKQELKQQGLNWYRLNTKFINSIVKLVNNLWLAYNICLNIARCFDYIKPTIMGHCLD